MTKAPSPTQPSEAEREAQATTSNQVSHLILWRHAEAEDGAVDMERALTAKGQAQAKRVAQWLNAQLPRSREVWVSPAKRTLQTANALTSDYRIVPAIAPDEPVSGMLELTDPNHLPLDGRAHIVVGHQPTIGLVATRWLAGEPQLFSVRKGMFIWMTIRLRDGRREVTLRAALAPEQIPA